jgi:hypothetical protein
MQNVGVGVGKPTKCNALQNWIKYFTKTQNVQFIITKIIEGVL